MRWAPVDRVAAAGLKQACDGSSPPRRREGRSRGFSPHLPRMSARISTIFVRSNALWHRAGCAR